MNQRDEWVGKKQLNGLSTFEGISKTTSVAQNVL